MRRLFFIIGLCLVAAGSATYLTMPENTSDVPILYWVTDVNPARAKQVELFHQWMIDQGHVNEDGKPLFELRMDTSSGSGSKVIVQGVSGVAADILSATIEYTIPDYEAIGIIEDVTERAKEMGFDLSTTFGAASDLITVNGRQFGYPCNAGVWSLWANMDRFEALGMQPPPRHWDFDTFERIGREYVKRANVPGKRQEKFYCDSPFGMSRGRMLIAMHRSLGLSRFNETMTRCTIDDPRYIQMLERIYKWENVDQLFPSAAEMASLSGESGYGGGTIDLFMRGDYAMACFGRWGLIRVRDFDDPPRLSVSAFPADRFNNMLIGVRPAAIYAGSKHKDLAVYFLAFLASEPYNRDIVTSADALPANPRFAVGREYTHPADFQNEWGCHEVILDFAQNISTPESISPYVGQNATWRWQKYCWDVYLGDIMSVEQAVKESTRRIHSEMDLMLDKSPGLRERYEQDLKLQDKIVQYREQGKPVPLDWIRNPFYRHYYLAQGWAAVVEPTAAQAHGGER